MKKKLLPIALLAVLAITGCSGADTSTQSGGGNTTNIVEPANVTELTISNKAKLQAEWHLDDPKDAGRKVEITTNPEIHYLQHLQAGHLKVVSSDPTVVLVKGFNLTPLKVGTATITVSYGEVSDTATITVSPEKVRGVQSIAEIRTEIANGDIEEDDYRDFYGQITGTMQQVDGQIHNGVYLQDGDNSMMLYAGKLTESWFNKDGTPKLAIGDQVVVTKGKYAPYSGLQEFKPQVELRKLTADDKKTIATPTVLNINYDNVDSLAGKDSIRYKAENLVYVEGSIETLLDHNPISAKFVKEGKEDKPIDLAINYHIGKEEMAAVKAKMDNLAPGVTFSMEGILSWRGEKPQLSLAYIDGKTPSQCIEIGEQPDPTGITISGPKEVNATDTIKLEATVAPATASQAVAWSVDDEAIATIDSFGNLTGIAEGEVTVTATSTKINTVTATYKVKVNRTPFPDGYAVVDPVVGGIYKFGFNKDGVVYYALDEFEESGKYGNTTTDKTKAKDAIVEKCGEGYALKVGAKYYGIVEKVSGDNTFANFGLADEPIEMQYDAEAQSFFRTVAGKDYFLGTKTTGSYTTVSTRKREDLESTSLMQLYDLFKNDKVEKTIAEGEFNIKNPSFNEYLTATSWSHNLKAGSVYNAAKVVVAKAGEQYTLKVGDKYLAALAGEWFVNLVTADAPYNWNYDAETNTLRTSIAYTKKGSTPKDYFVSYNNEKGIFELADPADIDAKTSAAFVKIPAAETLPAAKAIVNTTAGELKTLVGGQLKLSTQTFPAAANQDVVWTSSNEEVATVSYGVVKGIALGKVTITATAKGSEHKVEIPVEIVAPKEVKSTVVFDGKALGFTSDGYNTSKTMSATKDGIDISHFGVGYYAADGIRFRTKTNANAVLYNTNTDKEIVSITITYLASKINAGEAPKGLAVASGNSVEACERGGIEFKGEVDTAVYTILLGYGATNFRITTPSSGTRYIESITVNLA